ncbi:hypothetical protein BC567DRAFT_206294 [Phyllosticta citribraziliensis]
MLLDDGWVGQCAGVVLGFLLLSVRYCASDTVYSIYGQEHSAPSHLSTSPCLRRAASGSRNAACTADEQRARVVPVLDYVDNEDNPGALAILVVVAASWRAASDIE